MKKGKIVLGIAAIVVTTASAFALKVAKRLNAHRLYYQFIDLGSGTPISCHVCPNVFKCTRGRCRTIIACTIDDVRYTTSTLYTAKTDAGIVCINPTTRFTIVQ